MGYQFSAVPIAIGPSRSAAKNKGCDEPGRPALGLLAVARDGATLESDGTSP
jgi:hypothetical protein